MFYSPVISAPLSDSLGYVGVISQEVVSALTLYQSIMIQEQRTSTMVWGEAFMENPIWFVQMTDKTFTFTVKTFTEENDCYICCEL